MNNPGLEIFIATSVHAEPWAKLRHALWPDCPPARHALEIQQLLATEGVVALARLNNEIVGMAELSIRRDHVEGSTISPVPYLEGWFVAEHARNQGIGRALLGFVEDWSRTRGYHEIASDAELDNTHSIRLHTALGFREVGRSVHFVKPLK
jgi:aminoglycoside 6'-N-acetyltransferase I